MKRIEALLLRHAESHSNAATDVVALPDERGDRLTGLGERQAEAAARHLAEQGIARIVCSPMRRARQTAAPLAALSGLEVEVWDWIHELREPADYTGLSKLEQQRQRWSHRMLERLGDPDHSRGGGESFADVLGRVERTRDRLAAEQVDRTLVVSHGIFLRFLFARTLLGEGFQPADVARLWRIGSVNCGLSTFEHRDEPADSEDPADVGGWRCISWMAPTVPGEIATRV